MDKQELVAMALKKGAEHAVPFNIEDIEFDSRTLLKCMFGWTVLQIIQLKLLMARACP